MTACSRRRALAVALAALALPGCFCGHVLAYGRRRAEPDVVRAVGRTASGIVVGWDGRVTDDDGRTPERGTWWSRGARRRKGDRSGARAGGCGASELHDRPRRRPVRGGRRRRRGRPRAAGAGSVGRPCDALARLTRVWTAPWTYALMPVAVAADVIAMPFFIVMTPAAWLFGD
jgi:hypothetical protein